MGVRNYLIEGGSCTGKTTVCNELQRRGYQAIHGDRELAYQGDPETGKQTDTASHKNHIWDVDKVKALADNKNEPITFFCGGSRNFSKFLDLFDGVFVLEVDRETLHRRLDERPENEFGGKKSERELIARLHRTKEDIPQIGTIIDATAPIEDVVDAIVRKIEGD
ncbi:nucleoside kinase [Bacillus sp. AFS015802]|uniref:AAA family ATPase n=1 Tax=Bacillus sp. AFS015802 TaxID=2033486 RepID=UPI000BF5F62B|nr:AAA family ATPase [Bacillus sp. AFS015802]PFA69197.1 nucleoside kinase [Bacillus sp. AFS015802]